MQRKILPLILLILSVSLNAQNSRASDLGNELIKAAAKGDLERVKYLVINTSVDINYIYYKSVGLDNMELLAMYLDGEYKRDAEVENYISHSSTALSCAVEIGNLEMVKFLVNNGANINLLIGNKYYSSDYAMKKGYKNYSSLNYATKKGNLEIVKFLVSKGADINPNSGCPPLISALEEEYPLDEYFEIVKFLVSNKANVNVAYQGSTPLTLAVRGGNLQIVKFLVDNKADINTVGYGGKTPISIAKERGWRDIVSYLKTKGASE